MFDVFLLKIKQSSIAQRIAKGSFWSFFGTAVAKAIVLVAGIICAHILTKEEYGQLGMVRSTINMFVAIGVAGLGVTATKFIAQYKFESPSKIQKIVSLTNQFAIVTGFVVSGIIYFFSQTIAVTILHAPDLSPSIKAGALLLFVTVMNGAQNGTLVGLEDFKSIAINTLLGSIAESVFMLIGAYYGGVFFAILGFGIGYIVLYITNQTAIRRHLRYLGLEYRYDRITAEDWKILLNFSLPAALSSMIVAPTLFVIRTVLVRNSGFENLAIYEAAEQWRVIILFIPSAICQVVLPILSSLSTVENNTFWKVLRLNIGLNAGIATIITLIVCLLAPFIMHLYGSMYVSDSITLMILSASTIFSSMASVVGAAIQSRSKVWNGLFFNVLWSFVVVLLSIFFVKSGYGARGIALSVLVSYTIHTGLQLIYLHYIFKK